MSRAGNLTYLAAQPQNPLPHGRARVEVTEHLRHRAGRLEPALELGGTVDDQLPVQRRARKSTTSAADEAAAACWMR